MSTPAGRPWRVITISSRAASFKYRERSSFTSASATRRGGDTLLVEPRLRVGFRDDRKDFDCCFCDVIEHPDLAHPQTILRALQSSEALDPATADLRRLVAEVQLDRFTNA